MLLSRILYGHKYHISIISPLEIEWSMTIAIIIIIIIMCGIVLIQASPVWLIYIYYFESIIDDDADDDYGGNDDVPCICVYVNRTETSDDQMKSASTARALAAMATDDLQKSQELGKDQSQQLSSPNNDYDPDNKSETETKSLSSVKSNGSNPDLRYIHTRIFHTHKH